MNLLAHILVGLALLIVVPVFLLILIPAVFVGIGIAVIGLISKPVLERLK